MNTNNLIPTVDLNDQEVMDVNRRPLSFLRSRTSKINVIDVGCARGSLSDYIQNRSNLMFESLYIVGIDPLVHRECEGLYSDIVHCAIDNVGDSILYADFYVNNDDQASSLLQMAFENISDDLADRDTKYYIEWAKKLGVKSVQKVQVISLKRIVDEFFSNKKIHFLKIDAEGKDLDIMKSMMLESTKNIPLFVSMECSSHRAHPEMRIFKNGCHKSDVLDYMKSIGYLVLDCFDYEYVEHNLTQMSDITFVHSSIEEWTTDYPNERQRI